MIKQVSPRSSYIKQKCFGVEWALAASHANPGRGLLSERATTPLAFHLHVLDLMPRSKDPPSDAPFVVSGRTLGDLE